MESHGNGPLGLILERMMMMMMMMNKTYALIHIQVGVYGGPAPSGRPAGPYDLRTAM
jgi:hypothetical protein